MPVTSGAIGTNNTTVTTAATFIPQVWSDEVIAAQKRRLVIVNSFRRLSFRGQKGNVMNLPTGVRGTANLKVAGSQVQIQKATEGNLQITVNRHFEASRLIEDIVGIQAMASLRRFYTDDIGYQLARQKDTDLAAEASKLNGGAGTAAYAAAYIGGDGTTLYTSGANNSTNLTDAGIRRLIQRLDEGDNNMDGRNFIITAGQRNVLMGIARFTEEAFVGEDGMSNTIRNGRIGNVYGIPVKVSNNLPTATGGARVCIMAMEDALVVASQLDVRVQTQYKLEYLGDLMVADTLYGTQCRLPGTTDIPTGGYAIAVPT